MSDVLAIVKNVQLTVMKCKRELYAKTLCSMQNSLCKAFAYKIETVNCVHLSLQHLDATGQGTTEDNMYLWLDRE